MSNRQLDKLISPDVISVSPGTSIVETIERMRINKISSIVILEDKKPVGIFTERDIIRFFVQSDSGQANGEIHAYMTSPVFTGKINTDIFETFRMMDERNIRHLVVVDDKNQVIGVLTLTNILDRLYDKYCNDLQKVSDIMRPTPLNISTKSTIFQVLTEMVDHHLSCIVVTDDDGRPVGIFTERDAAQLFLQEVFELQQPISTMMRSPVIPVLNSSPLTDAVAMMRDNNFRRAVVVDESGRLQGLVTQSDIVRAMDLYFQRMMTMLRG